MSENELFMEELRATRAQMTDLTKLLLNLTGKPEKEPDEIKVTDKEFYRGKRTVSHVKKQVA